MTTPLKRARPDFVRYGPDRIREAVGFEDVVEPVARALTDFSRGLGEAPVAMFAPMGHDGDVHVKSAWLPGRSIFTVKIATWFAARAERGDPPGGGVVAAFDARTGDLRVFWRRRASDRYSHRGCRCARRAVHGPRRRRRPRRFGIGGPGVSPVPRGCSGASRGYRADLGSATGPGRAPRQGAPHQAPELSIDIVDTPRHACDGAHLVVTTTASLDPLIEAGWLQPGVHVTAVGADDATKCELAPDCLAAADRIVVDSRALSAEFGDVARAFRTGAIGPSRITGELGEVVAGLPPGRTGDGEITICKLIGLGVQDLAAAEVTLERLESSSPSQRRPASALDL